eukprot:4705653-Karenia_brevis.AAC.1
MQPRDDAHVLWFDGGCQGNPGPAAAGAVLYAPAVMGGGVVWSGQCFVSDHGTNNVAEYNGAIMGLRAAMRTDGIQALHIRGDSVLVIRQ